MLDIIGINKSYENQQLLRDISFSIEKEEVVCLLGPSGSGKSTLLRLISGLEQPESGDILWQGSSILNIPVHQRKFSLMFQDYALFPHRTVFENIAFGLRMQKIDQTSIQKRVQDLLSKVGLSNLSNRRVTSLSGGEQQRVALARALAPQPRLLMLDEPMGALDKTLKEQLIQELHKNLHESKNTGPLRDTRSGRGLCYCRPFNLAS